MAHFEIKSRYPGVRELACYRGRLATGRRQSSLYKDVRFLVRQASLVPGNTPALVLRSVVLRIPCPMDIFKLSHYLLSRVLPRSSEAG
ncbi:MAG: hypothetical protein ACI9NT_002157 [Bacteroidia bacterium]|jgi:hypothetical protein